MIDRRIIYITFVLIMMQMVITTTAENNAVDRFGIRKLYENAPLGREWISNWDNGHARSWTDSSNDPYDDEFVTKYKGTGSWKTDGSGILKISGATPRMYVIDPDQTNNWHNVEITLYGMRIADKSVPWGGLEAVARTNHFLDADQCDTRGIDARFRYDGHIDFEKETSHPDSVAINNKAFFGNALPKNVWIGYKLVVYDLPNGNVKMESWYDSSDGQNGGNWVKLNELIDDGTNFGTASQGGIACKSGINPGLKLTSSDIRQGSETGKANMAVYFRSDGVGTDGLWYKKVSVREISPDKTIPNPTPSPSPTPSPTPTQSTNPIGYWKFNDNTGTIAADSSGNTNNGNINGAAWTSGKSGSGLNFNGLNNYVDIASGSKFNSAKALTLEAWIKPASASTSMGIIGKKEWSSTVNGYHFLLNKGRIVFDAGDGFTHKIASSDNLSWPIGAWYHIAVTFNNGTVIFFRNGVKVASSISVSRIADNSQDLYIGSTKSTTYPFNGVIDEVKIYNRALSAGEVQSDYTSAQKAVRFDGTSSYVEVPDHDDFSATTTGGLTVSLWLRPDALDFTNTDGNAPEGGRVDFLGKGEYSSQNQIEWYFRMYNKTNATRANRISFYIFNLSGGKGIGSYFQDNVTVGKWIHVVGKIDNKYIYIYKNGILRDKDDYAAGSIRPRNGVAPLRIGTVSKSNYIKGALDDIMIYNRSLTDAEILNLYNGNKPRNGIVAEWPTDEGNGSNLKDTSGRNHNGKLYGNAAWTTGHG